VYVFVIYIGIEKQNINLEKTIKFTNTVENFGVDYHYPNRGAKSAVFYLKLKDLDQKLGVFRMSKNYNNLLKLFKVGDMITVFYFGNSNKKENVNIDLVQIERSGKTLLSKSEYEKKESFLIYIGIGGLIINFFIIKHYRRKYLKTIQK
jgi:hypothetical protein